MNVSRETDRPGADVLEALFPAHTESISRFVDLLINTGVERGLIGPREVPRIWNRHIVNCAVVRDLLAPGASVADIGSGAGLPGLVLAISRPDLRFVLIEPLLRRAVFLTRAVDDLQLANVSVIRDRAENLAGAYTFDAVTARAVAPLSRLVPWGLPLCRAGGELLAMKGSTAESEVADAKSVLASFRAGAVTIDQCGEGWVEPPTTVVRIQSSGHLPATRKARR